MQFTDSHSSDRGEPFRLVEVARRAGGRASSLGGVRPFARATASATATAAATALATAFVLTALPPLAHRAAAQDRPAGAGAGVPPASGTELLQRMHDRWASGQPWFHTITFTQQTTVVRRDGTTNVSTWYESILAPDRLRIDFGDPKAGNGVLYTADSSYVMREGKVTRTTGEGNPFLPFVVGVYTQPLERTLAQLAPLGVDMSVVRSGRWRDRPVYVVGARDTSDLSSPQFWVDSERLILLRMVLAPSGNVSNGSGRPEPLDIHLDDYVEVGGGWLATKVAMYAGGKARQTEVYTSWRAGTELSPRFFVAEDWGKVPHWAVVKP